MFDSFDNDGLDREITDLAGRIAAATCRWLLLVAEFDRRAAHEEWGYHSCAEWLAWRCSVAPRAAREHLRVARCLPELQATRRAFSRGELSYSKVRALTRVADPDNEAELVELALHATAAQLERVVRVYRGVLDVATAKQAHERRYFAYSWEDDGSLSFRGSLAGEDGALLLRALEAGREAMRDRVSEGVGSAGDGSAGPRLDRGPVNADALVALAENLLAGASAVRGGGERTQVVLHVGAEALGGGGKGREGGSQLCSLDEGVALSAETARRIACDASLVQIVDGDKGPLHVGRRRRTVPAAMRRALMARDGGCRFPGCENRRWIDAHHIRHWVHGGETSIENLVQLCRRHHRLVHEGGFSVVRGDDGQVQFRRPGGELIAEVPIARARDLHGQRSRGTTLRSPLRAPLPPAASSPVPLSAGESLDLDLTTTILSRQACGSPRGP